MTSSDSAASLSQAIPAAVVAIYVLALGSLFVVAQLSVAAYGHRVVLLDLFDDPLVARVAIRPPDTRKCGGGSGWAGPTF